MKKISLKLFVMILFAAIFTGCKNDDPVIVPSLTGAEVKGICVIKTEVDEANSLITYYVPTYTPEVEFAKCKLEVNPSNGTLSPESSNVDLSKEEVAIVVNGKDGVNKTYTVKREFANINNVVGAIANKYNGNLAISINKETAGAPVEQVVSIVSAGFNAINLEIKNFSFGEISIGTISAKNIYLYKSDKADNLFISGVAEQTLTIGGQKIEATLDVYGTYEVASETVQLSIAIGGVTGMEIVAEFKGTTYADETDCTPLFISVKGSKVLSQEFKNGSLTYYGDAKNAPEDYADIEFEIKLPKGARYEFETGDKFDFTKKANYFNVFSASGAKKRCNITRENIDMNNATSYNFTEWNETPNEVEGMGYFDPVGWTTPNLAVVMIKSMSGGELYPITGEFPVTPSTNGKEGKCAKIMTLDTKGGLLGGTINSPKVTSGTIYTGTFNFFAAMSDPMLATEFGLAYSGAKPLSLKGWYKYTPGPIYYDVKTEDKTKTDEPSIAVVIYDVTDNIKATLTGVDIYTSPRIIATGMINPPKSSEFKEFNVPITYSREYTPSKGNVYKMAIIISSSKDGAAFKGAPLSTMYVDEIQLVVE